MNPIPSSAGEAAALRARIRAETGLDEAVIRAVVDAFYGRIREDALLGPIFAAHVRDWSLHMPRMYAFWNSVALSSGEYDGQPMRVHMPLPVEGKHFAHWLALFEATAQEICTPAGVDWLMERARRIARSLEMGVSRFDPAGRGGGRVTKPRLPARDAFPPGAHFVLKEFDVPLVQMPDGGWINWFGGAPRAYHPAGLKLGNHWPATFEEWLAAVRASIS